MGICLQGLILQVFVYCLHSDYCKLSKGKKGYFPTNFVTLPTPVPIPAAVSASPVAENMFYIKNQVFSLGKHQFQASADSMNEMEHDWNLCMMEYKRMMKRIMTFPTQNIQHILKIIRESRDRMHTVLNEVKLKMEEFQDIQIKLDRVAELMKKSETEKEKNKDYVENKMVARQKLVDAPFYSTICGNCSIVCHNRCGEIKADGTNRFRNCAAFSGDNCMRCKDRCSYHHHYHAMKTFKIEQVQLSTVLEEMKLKYEEAIKETDEAKQQLSANESTKKSLQHAVDQQITKLNNTAVEIMKYCSGFNFVNELHVTVAELELKRNMITNSGAMALADQFIRTIKSIIEEMERQNVVNNSKKLAQRKALVEKQNQQFLYEKEEKEDPLRLHMQASLCSTDPLGAHGSLCATPECCLPAAPILPRDKAKASRSALFS
jgi:hypothetical protein